MHTTGISTVFLPIGYVFASKEPSITSFVLGSGVAVCIWDRKTKYGGMCSFLYPVCKKKMGNPTFGNSSIIALLRLLRDFGCKRKDLEAQIFGGAFLGDKEKKNAVKNIRIAQKMMKKFSIPVISQDTGGSKGRKISYKITTNEVLTLRVDKIRRGDWYPYIARR